MSIFQDPDFDGHEQVEFVADAETGLRAIIAIHNTNLGPALGGVRRWRYESEASAINDALRLSRGMTYKAALAGLPLGGGKSVILDDGNVDEEALRAFGRAVDRLGGRYIAAEDVGTSPSDMHELASETSHVVGLPETDGGHGDPSPHTALGVFRAMEAAVDHLGWADGLAGRRVAVQGLGHVGSALAGLLADAGAILVVADIDPDCTRAAAGAFDAKVSAPDGIHAEPVDIYAPCALGNAVNDTSLPQIRAKVIVGSANNQLATAAHGQRLKDRGILYVPDYLANAGGLIHVALTDVLGASEADSEAATNRIYDTTRRILREANQSGLDTAIVADRMAERRLRGRGHSLAA